MSPVSQSVRSRLRIAAASTLLVATAASIAPATAAPATDKGSKPATGSTGTKGKPVKPPTSPTPTVGPATCWTLPDAAALGTVRGRTINTLFAHEGRVYYGYGDYNANTGSSSTPYGTNISSINPADGTTKVHLPGFKTEEINTFRAFDGDIYAPSIDPSIGANSKDSFATDNTGTWAENDGASGPIHVFDVTKAGGDLFIAGAAADPNTPGSGLATIWRSADNGVTWEKSLEETEADPAMRNGFERYYWIAAIGGKVYAKATLNGGSQMRVYDTATDKWGTASEGFSAFAWYVQEGNQVLSYNGRLWSVSMNSLVWFDGSTTGNVMTSTGTSISAARANIGADGLLYVSDPQGGIYRVDYAVGARTATLVRVASVPVSSRPFTVANGRVLLGGAPGVAQVCSYPMS